MQRQWWNKQEASDVDSSYVFSYAQQTLRIVWGRSRLGGARGDIMCYLSGGVQVGSRGGVIVAYHEDIRVMRMFKGPSVQKYLRQQSAPLVFPIS